MRQVVVAWFWARLADGLVGSGGAGLGGAPRPLATPPRGLTAAQARARDGRSLTAVPLDPPSLDVGGLVGDRLDASGEDVCLMPGEVVVRVDKAPSNSRRIYTGVDIRADIDVVWRLLVDYERLADVVPNLVANEVISKQSQGARLRQVGSAQVLPGVNFRASMVLDVKELRTGLSSALIRGGARSGDLDTDAMRKAEESMPVERGVFPRPWATCHQASEVRDITMLSVRGEPGDFTLYQGLWRMQTVPQCDGATRLTFAVEIQPRPWLPVALVESRIAADLVKNLQAVHEEATRRSDVMIRNKARERAMNSQLRAPTTTLRRSPPTPSPEPPSSGGGGGVGVEPPPREDKPLVDNVADRKRVARLRAVLVDAVDSVKTGIPGGLGASATEIRRVRLAADRLGETYRTTSIMRHPRAPSRERGCSSKRFDAVAHAGRWRVRFSSAIAEALLDPREDTTAPTTLTALAPFRGGPAKKAPAAETELGVIQNFARTFPRLTTLASRFALRSIDFVVRPSPSGDRLDTIIALRNRAQPFPAPALRLENALIASKTSDGAMIQERVRVEAASNRFKQLLPKPTLPVARSRMTAFDVLFADDDLLVTLSTDGDLRVATRLLPANLKKKAPPRL